MDNIKILKKKKKLFYLFYFFLTIIFIFYFTEIYAALGDPKINSKKLIVLLKQLRVGY